MTAARWLTGIAVTVAIASSGCYTTLAHGATSRPETRSTVVTVRAATGGTVPLTLTVSSDGGWTYDLGNVAGERVALANPFVAISDDRKARHAVFIYGSRSDDLRTVTVRIYEPPRGGRPIRSGEPVLGEPTQVVELRAPGSRTWEFVALLPLTVALDLATLPLQVVAYVIVSSGSIDP